MRLQSFGSPVVGARAWLGAALVLVAVRTGLGTLESLIAAGPWLAAATVAAVLVLLSSALTRTVGAAEWAPVAALVTAVAVVSVGYGGESGAGLPGPGTPGRLADLIGEGARPVQEGRTPVTADRGLELMIVIGAVAVVVVVDTLALGLRSAGLAGAVLAALWAPTLVFERPPSTITLLLGATAWLLLVWLTRPVRGPDTGPWRELPTAA
ncbi:MAG TPA: transglutaminaseTgpA domain-containing protein, partial [Actinotalea sp.]|nr:transglutaminaseTgpA domain-containing protein [Actinotalea sp.]